MSLIDKLPYEWAVGIRYTRAGKRSARNSFISFISLISVSGIALGVAALIVVLSVMNGFQKEVTDRMLSVLAHIEVFDASGSMPNWRDAVQDALLAACPDPDILVNNNGGPPPKGFREIGREATQVTDARDGQRHVAGDGRELSRNERRLAVVAQAVGDERGAPELELAHFLEVLEHAR